jgi:biotin synthase
MNKKEIVQALKTNDPQASAGLFSRAYEVKRQHVGATVYFRGIIEFSNICVKDCYYCGIRKSNSAVGRFAMRLDEIVEAAVNAYRWGYGSIVLQSGERCDEEFALFVEKAILAIKKKTNNCLGITLSLGEQDKDTFKRWYDAGAHRYLLRIETSNSRLYGRLHPEDHDHKKRIESLAFLRDIGYQVGTGVMIGLPFQTYQDLAGDIIFFKDSDIDMIGMGPYIIHKDTPLAGSGTFSPGRNFQLSLKMIAAARILLKDVNIASTTALQVLHPRGREEGLKAGANIIMPNITPAKYRQSYRLYEGKPCIDEDPRLCHSCLEKRIQSIGEVIGYGQWGDAPHFFKHSALPAK